MRGLCQHEYNWNFKLLNIRELKINANIFNTETNLSPV